jgi:predicted MFS family arabinose efflux permease
MFEADAGPMQNGVAHKKLAPITPREWGFLLVLAAIQFTVILDFMIIMPLQLAYQRQWPDLTPLGFGIIVGSYAMSAGFSGLLGAFFTDRFDRKKSMLVLLGGFTVGTFLCGVAPDYYSLVAGRVVAGAFGGIIGAVSLAIIGDLFHDARRGRATGVLMWGFSLATILGVPSGLFLKKLEGGAGVPFIALALFSLVIWVLAIFVLPQVRSHIDDRSKGFLGALLALLAVMTDATHLRAYLFMFFMVASSFLIFPSLAEFVVANVGLNEDWELPWVYICGGAATIISLPVVGWFSDRWGKRQMFRLFGSLTVVPILLSTNLDTLLRGFASRSLVVGLTLASTTLFMVITSGRSVPALAMITASSRPRYRGSFLSFNAAVQQFAGAIAAGVAGFILVQPHNAICMATGAAGVHVNAPIYNFPIVGALGVAMTIASVALAELLRPAAIEPNVENEPETEEELIVEGRASDTGVVSTS